MDKSIKEELIPIQPEYLYLTIPAEWVCIYHKLLVLMADFGKNLMNDCNCSHNHKLNNIMICWNIFQSAIACKELNRDKEAELFINYINKQLSYIYSGTNYEIYNGGHYYKISDDGKLKALCSCADKDIKFYVDVDTGKLYEEYLNADKNNSNFLIQDDDLIVVNNNKI